MPSNKDQLQKLLKGLETGDAMAAAVVNEEKYIQHNPQTHEGSEGLAVLFARLAKTEPRVHFKRVFEDGDYAFAHIEYDFSTLRAAFEVFRFEDGYAVEHWDNIQPKLSPNPSGRGMLDGETTITDLNKTEVNRAIVRDYVERVLIGRAHENIASYVDAALIQHHPDLADGLPALRSYLVGRSEDASAIIYVKLHKILAEGNFVLCACEGHKHGLHSSFYDLYRVENGRIIEQWNTTEKIPPKSEWKNDNGKF